MGPDISIMIWVLELMVNKYKLLRQHMKFNLPTTTKTLLENPTDTLDQIIKMTTQWDTLHLKNAIHRKRDLGRNTKTLDIVVNLLDIPIIPQDMNKAVVNNTTTEIDCS